MDGYCLIPESFNTDTETQSVCVCMSVCVREKQRGFINLFYPNVSHACWFQARMCVNACDPPCAAACKHFLLFFIYLCLPSDIVQRPTSRIFKIRIKKTNKQKNLI